MADIVILGRQEVLVRVIASLAEVVRHEAFTQTMDTVLKHACVYVMSNETQTASLLLYLELTHCTREATSVAQ